MCDSGGEAQALEGKISLESQALDSKLNEHMEALSFIDLHSPF